jgi:trk system potassium uptake protein TrkH
VARAERPRPVGRSAARTPRTGAPAVLTVAVLVLGIVSLFVEQAGLASPAAELFTQTLDFTLLALLIAETTIELARAGSGARRLRARLPNLLFLLVFTALFAYNKVLHFSRQETGYGTLQAGLLILRNSFLLLKVFSRVRRLAAFVRGLTAQPARTVLLSFVLVILTGTLLLMIGLTTPDGRGLPLVDALFTSTSAVCVTGLIVVDTATAFTLWGKLILLALIQIGGLGIMVLSFFVAFVTRRALSVEDRFLLSYMTNERDLSNLGRSVLGIVTTTLIIEAAGAVLLFAGFRARLGGGPATVFTAIFHAVSAFCNAGFSLFSDSLQRFRSNPFVNAVICLLIIGGGLSFAVIFDLRDRLRERLRPRTGPLGRRRPLGVNTRTVLVGTALLLVVGTLLVYASEHDGALRSMDVGTQYLASFFQSVTARTAGFNTIPFGGLRTSTYLILMCLMFVGAASGSTAGGVKINAVGVIFAYVRSMLRDRDDAMLFGHAVPRALVLRAFLILLFALVAVIVGILVLSVTERAPFVHLGFEAVSAFATVGLSAGVTPGLSVGGKLVLIVLMFVGRVGPLTVLAAAVRGARKIEIGYPTADIIVG